MKQLQLYIGKTIISTTLIVALLVAGLVFLFTMVSELGDIGHGDYGVMQALYYVTLASPIQFYQIFPIVGLIGSIVGLGFMASRSELTVMRAAGYSLGQIIISVLKAAFVLVLLVTLFGETIAPWTMQHATEYKQAAVSGGQAIQTENGLWLRDKKTIIHIREVLPNKHIKDITRYQFDGHNKLLMTSFAKDGYYQNKHWVLQDIKKSIFGPNGITTKEIASMVSDMIVFPNLLGMTDINPATMNLYKLYDYMQFQRKNKMGISTFEFSFWQRIFQPISTGVMMFLAIPFVFGSLRSVTMGLRIIMGILVGGGFYLLNQFLGPFSLVYQVPPFLAASFPTIVFAGLAYYLMQRTR